MVSNIKNDRLLKALMRQPVDKTPVWLMRQAGRYLPEYQQVRKQAGDFMTLCRTPELACEVTLQPLRRFSLDAAILFSDILTIPDAMGLGLYFEENHGPKFERPLTTVSAIEKLPEIDVETELAYVNDAVRLIKQELDNTLPLIGFSGSPWTLASYMIEGGSSKDFRRIKQFLYDQPQALHLLLSKLSSSIADYLNAQINAGVNAVMLFDTWGGVLTTRDYQQFSLQYMQEIIAKLHREKEGEPIPVVVFTKNGGQWLETIANSGCDAVGIDWTTDIGQARQRIGHKVALQGNLDPMLMHCSAERISEEVKTILEAYGSGPGHVFNLGHGITPQVPVENVTALVDAVHQYSVAYHQNEVLT